MAYAFDKVQKLLEPNQGFALAGDNQGQQAPSAGLTSNVSGQDPQAGTSTGSPAPAPNYNQPSTSAASRGVLSKNRGQVKTPIDLGGLQTNINEAEKNLKAEANKYTASAADPYKNWLVDQQEGSATTGVAKSPRLESDVKKYIDTGMKGFTQEADPFKASTSYEGNLNKPNQPKDWYELAMSAPLEPEPFKPTTVTDFKGVSELMSGAGGLRNLFQSSGGARYTPGMAAMDTSLLLQSPGFATDAENIVKSVGGLKNKEAEILDNAPKAARNVSKNYRDLLRGEIEDIARSEEARLQGVQEEEVKSPRKFTNFAKQADVIKNNLISENPQWAGFINSIGDEGLKDLIIAATKPGNIGSLRWEDYIDEDEARDFNRIQELLGSGKTFVKGNRNFKDTELDWEKLRGALQAGSEKYQNPTVVDNLPPPPGGSPTTAGIPATVGRTASGDSVTNWVIDTPLGPVTVKPPFQPPSSKDAEQLVKDALVPAVPLSRELSRDLSIPSETTAGKVVSGIEGMFSGPGGAGPGGTVASAPAVSFPSVQSMLGGGKSSTYEGKIDPSMIAGGYINPTAAANAPMTGPLYVEEKPKQSSWSKFMSVPKIKLPKK